MTKAQVIAIMDDEGEEGGISRSAQGTMETLHFHPGYGSRYVSALKSGYTFGMAGRAGRQGATVSFRNGRVMHINSY